MLYFFEIISATIRATILSAMYLLSLLITASDIPRFLYLFKVNIADTCVAVTAILTANIDKKREILLAVISKDRKYIAYRMVARIVADIISKEKTTQQCIFCL